MVKVWERHHNPGKAVHVLILKCLKASVAMEKILNENKDAYALRGTTCILCFYTESAWNLFGIYLESVWISSK